MAKVAPSMGMLEEKKLINNAVPAAVREASEEILNIFAVISQIKAMAKKVNGFNAKKIPRIVATPFPPLKP